MPTYGPFHGGARAAQGAPCCPGVLRVDGRPGAFRSREGGSDLGGRQCCRLFRWWPQVFGRSAAVAQECTDGLKTGVSFRISGIDPDGLLIALDGEFVLSRHCVHAPQAGVCPRVSGGTRNGVPEV